MTGILSQLRAVTEDLHELNVRWALVGGLAVSVHAEPRSTRDIDVAIALPDKDLQKSLVSSLIKKGYRNEQVLMHLIPTHALGVRLQIRSADINAVAVDLLFSSSGIEPEIVSAASMIEIFPQLLIPIACPGHLIAMKVLAQNNEDRLRDRTDLRELLARASNADVAITLNALTLMKDRGFSRGKDLIEEYKQALRDFAPHLLSIADS